MDIIRSTPWHADSSLPWRIETTPDWSMDIYESERIKLDLPGHVGAHELLVKTSSWHWRCLHA